MPEFTFSSLFEIQSVVAHLCVTKEALSPAVFTAVILRHPELQSYAILCSEHHMLGLLLALPQPLHSRTRWAESTLSENCRGGPKGTPSGQHIKEIGTEVLSSPELKESQGRTEGTK